MDEQRLNNAAAVDVAHPVIGPGHTYSSVTDKISSIVLTEKTPRGWLVGFTICFLGTMALLFTIANLLLG